MTLTRSARPEHIDAAPPRARHSIRLRVLAGALVLALIAAPLAFLGGLTPIKEMTFLLTLGASLIFAGIALLLPRAAAYTEGAKEALIAKKGVRQTSV